MSIKDGVAAVVLVLGIIILLVAFSMPATQTVQSESCTETTWAGDYRIDGTCTTATTEVPNTSRAPVGGVGFGFALVGMILLSKE